MPTAPPLPVSMAEWEQLQRLVRAHTTPQRLVKRAEGILMAGDRLPNPDLEAGGDGRTLSVCVCAACGALVPGILKPGEGHVLAECHETINWTKGDCR